MIGFGAFMKRSHLVNGLYQLVGLHQLGGLYQLVGLYQLGGSYQLGGLYQGTALAGPND